MNSKIFLLLNAVICTFIAIEAASLHAGVLDKTNAVVQKMDYEGVEENVRSARQTYPEDDSGEDSDEDDEEDDAELQHQAAIRRQQAYEQSVDNSQEGSDEDSEDNFEDDDDDFFGRRLKRDVSPLESNNESQQNSQTSVNQEKQPVTEASSTSSTSPSATGTSNTSVLILIRDAIKKVTELPNTQQVATSAQQYFQMFEHFLQQTIEQVIGDDDEEDEVESTTIVPETEKENITEINDQSDKQTLNETNDQESSSEHVSPQPEKEHLDVHEVKA